MESFFNREAKRRRPTMQVSMVAKCLQIETATMKMFTARDSFGFNSEPSYNPHDLESQAQFLLYEEEKVKVDNSTTQEQRRHLIKIQLLKASYTKEIVNALLFTNQKWQEITSIDQAINAVVDPTRHDFVR